MTPPPECHKTSSPISHNSSPRLINYVKSNLIKLINGGLGDLHPSLADHKVSSQGLQKLGLDRRTVTRAMQNSFQIRNHRSSVKVDDFSIRNRLDAHMENHSEQGWRSREMVAVRGRILEEPQRILTLPFKQCFEDFIAENPDIEVSVKTLYKMKEKWLNHYRQPRKTDRQIAMCQACQPLNMTYEAVKNTRAGSVAFNHTTDQFLMEFTICSELELQSRQEHELSMEELEKMRNQCIWSECPHCTKEKIEEKLQTHINFFLENTDTNGNEEITYSVYDDKTKAFVNQIANYKEEAANILATATFQGKTSGTGEKILNHKGRIIESTNYIESLFSQVAHGHKAVIIYFDHGKIKHNFIHNNC